MAPAREAPLSEKVASEDAPGCEAPLPEKVASPSSASGVSDQMSKERVVRRAMAAIQRRAEVDRVDPEHRERVIRDAADLEDDIVLPFHLSVEEAQSFGSPSMATPAWYSTPERPSSEADTTGLLQELDDFLATLESGPVEEVVAPSPGPDPAAELQLATLPMLPQREEPVRWRLIPLDPIPGAGAWRDPRLRQDPVLRVMIQRIVLPNGVVLEQEYHYD